MEAAGPTKRLQQLKMCGIAEWRHNKLSYRPITQPCPSHCATEAADRSPTA
jgi:hypothetical protein